MAAQPNIGGAICEGSLIPLLVACRKFWLTPAAPVSCINAACQYRRTQDLGRKVNFEAKRETDLSR